MARPTEEVYLLKNRSEEERDRLNVQHALVMKLMGGMLLHPSILLSDGMKFADVGTGTGIWLEALAAKVASESPRDNSPGQYDGFDISGAQFPKDEQKRFRWIEHNMLQPFSEEHQSLYDVVSVRFMALAFRKADYKTAVKNLINITKPGGYIQWVEFDMCHLIHDPAFKACAEVLNIIHDFQVAMGMSVEASIEIRAAFQEGNLSNVAKEAFFPHKHPELKAELQMWGTAGRRVGLRPAISMLGLDKSKEDAQQMTDRLAEGWDKEYAQGAVPQMPVVMIVGQKL